MSALALVHCTPYQEQGAAPPYSQRNTTPSPGPAQQPRQAQPEDYPVARGSSKPNQVISPYEPYNVIDVTGFSSGDYARDPTNGKIFRLP